MKKNLTVLFILMSLCAQCQITVFGGTFNFTGTATQGFPDTGSHTYYYKSVPPALVGGSRYIYRINGYWYVFMQGVGLSESLKYYLEYRTTLPCNSIDPPCLAEWKSYTVPIPGPPGFQWVNYPSTVIPAPNGVASINSIIGSGCFSAPVDTTNPIIVNSCIPLVTALFCLRQVQKVLH